ncbi:serine/threonine protein kinase [Chitinispirillum alkaliphilum]|nr:serine/threonine protein kinase [Chitinispirillum alkaliphilum]
MHFSVDKKLITPFSSIKIVALFSDKEIKNYAFPSVIESARSFISGESFVTVHLQGNDLIATVGRYDPNRIVISRQSDGSLRLNCTCGFNLGGACEHAVAAMLEANQKCAIQTSIDWDNLGGNCEPEEKKPRKIQPKVTELSAFKPVGRLYLTEYDSTLLVELRFSYNDGMVEFSRNDKDQSRLIPHQDGKLYRIYRSKAREALLASNLEQYDLQRYQTGTYTPDGDPRNWILQQLPQLAQEGFEVFGQENLRTVDARRSAPSMSVSVSSANQGVFELSLEVSFDGVAASLISLIHALEQGSKFVQLTDGTSGILPQEWIDKLCAFFSAFESKPDEKGNLPVRNTHCSLVDMLFDMADEKEADEVFLSERADLKEFECVEKHPLPQGLRCSLRPYQRAGYEWFYFLKKYRFGGCLADDMGLGKTVQTLALLLNEKLIGENQPSLIVVPTSLLHNWSREAEKFTPDLNTLIYHGAGRNRYRSVMHMADAVITTYGTVLNDMKILEKISFHYIILDEAQTIKNPLSAISKALRQLFAEHKLALSGTPVENNLSELWSLFSFLNPGMLGSLGSFKNKFIRPIQNELNENVAQVLRRMIFPFILRRTKEQVAKDLPPKSEFVLYSKMLPEQKKLYDITKESYRGKILRSLEVSGLEKTRFQVLEGMLRLRQICSHPSLADKSFNCDSGKYRLLDECITDIVSEGHRVLLFSQFVKSLELLRIRFAQLGIKSEMLTGSTTNRQAVVDRFQSEKGAPVFLISLKAGGTGLNLTSADYVIHLDPWWNPSAENQASDRAYRIGQKKAVFVYKLITQDSIEEHVLDLQNKKKGLIESVIRTESSFYKQLSRDDILGLFS